MDVNQSLISRIERGSRRVDLDEWLGICAGLGVSPVHMIVPTESDTQLIVAPHLIVPARSARQWIRGQVPLRAVNGRTFYSEVAEEELAAMEAQSFRFLLRRVQDLVDAWVDEDRDRAADCIDDINRELAHRQAELERQTKAKRRR
jgi:hypothetical protein